LALTNLWINEPLYLMMTSQERLRATPALVEQVGSMGQVKDVLRVARIIKDTLLGVAIGMLMPGTQQGAAQEQKNAYTSVDPFIGTAGGGNTFPEASLPFGMMQWSPDTGGDGWYRHKDTKIAGFSLTHLCGAGCPLYGDVPVLPWSQVLTESPAVHPERYAQAFSHAQEQAHPGYYAVTLECGVSVEIRPRAGLRLFRRRAHTDSL
jgi:putative alpha-1,2-mannosidase